MAHTFTEIFDPEPGKKAAGPLHPDLDKLAGQPMDKDFIKAVMSPDIREWYKYSLGDITPNVSEILMPWTRTGRFEQADKMRSLFQQAIIGQMVKTAGEQGIQPPSLGMARAQNPLAFEMSGGIQPSLLGVPQPPPIPGQLPGPPSSTTISPAAESFLMQQPFPPSQAAAYQQAVPQALQAQASLVSQRATKDELQKFTDMLLNAGIDPSGPEGQALYRQYAEKTATHPRASQVNVNTLLPASEEAQKDFMKSTRATYDQLKHAPVLLKNIEDAKALVPKAKGFMGTGGETFLAAAKFLNNRFGLNIAVEGIKNAEELRSRLFYPIMESLKKVDAQPSQMQQMIMMDALGRIGTDPNALPAILDAYADVLRGRVQLHNQEVVGAVSRGVKFPYDPTVKLEPIKKKSEKVIEFKDLPSGR